MFLNSRCKNKDKNRYHYFGLVPVFRKEKSLLTQQQRKVAVVKTQRLRQRVSTTAENSALNCTAAKLLLLLLLLHVVVVVVVVVETAIVSCSQTLKSWVRAQHRNCSLFGLRF